MLSMGTQEAVYTDVEVLFGTPQEILVGFWADFLE